MLGDHIRALKDGRWLHGIDLGDQRILFLSEAPGLAPGDRLRRVYRPEFTAGASRVELVVHRERAYPAKAVVARAWSRFMDPSVVAMFKDSEAFAAWCKIGRLPEAAPAPAPTAAAVAAAVRSPAQAPKVPSAKAPPKPAARKAKVVAGKPAPRKAAAKKAPARKAKKASVKKAPAKRATARKAPGRKAAARKVTAGRRPAARKAGKRTSRR